MLECRNLVVRYGAVEALHGCSLSVAEGTTTAVLRANGAGKSSLLKALEDSVAPAAGRILVDGEDVTSMPAQRRARLGISLALEGRRLFHTMTVEENLRLAWEFRSRSGDFNRGLERAFERFPILASRRDVAAGLLSGGQQQMLILSSALIPEPRYLLLDEPSLGLAPAIVQQIFRVIAAVCKRGRTAVLLSEQVVAQALRVSDFAYVLQRGSVVRQGPAEQFAKDPQLSSAYLT